MLPIVGSQAQPTPSPIYRSLIGVSWRQLLIKHKTASHKAPNPQNTCFAKKSSWESSNLATGKYKKRREMVRKGIFFFSKIVECNKWTLKGNYKELPGPKL